VLVTAFKDTKSLLKVAATIMVSRDTQKGIVIGAKVTQNNDAAALVQPCAPNRLCGAASWLYYRDLMICLSLFLAFSGCGDQTAEHRVKRRAREVFREESVSGNHRSCEQGLEVIRGCPQEIRLWRVKATVPRAADLFFHKAWALRSLGLEERNYPYPE
jgi:hypothetical protein